MRDGGFHFEPGCFLLDVAPAFLLGLESLEQALHLIYVSLTPAGSDGPILSNPLGSNDSTIHPKSFSLIWVVHLFSLERKGSCPRGLGWRVAFGVKPGVGPSLAVKSVWVISRCRLLSETISSVANLGS